MKRLQAGIVVVVLAAGCTMFGPPAQDVGSTRGVFHGRWWNYYERGASYLGGERYEAAVADFREALKGRSTDTWRARTYGLHFVEYFPNRELGVAYFHRGEYDEAETYLKQSLTHVDTARAHDYLDRVQEARIARGDFVDAAPPAIATSLEGIQRFSERELIVTIAATDDTGVRSVTLNGTPLNQRGSTRAIEVSERLLLDEGRQTITVAASDLAGKTTSTSYTLDVDLTGPTLGVLAPREGMVVEAGAVELRLAAVDGGGVAEILVNGAVLDGADGSARVELGSTVLLQPGENRIEILARDVAGNVTATVLAVYRGDPGSTAARRWQVQRQAPVRVASAATIPLHTFLMQADVQPAIAMKSPKPDAVYRHNRTLRVYGKVVSDAAITGVTVNGEAYAVAGSPNETFDRRIPLDASAFYEGEASYRVAIHAEDAEGKAADVAYDVTVRPVALNTRESKMPTAVLAFECSSRAELAQDLRTKTEASLLETARFNLLERQRLQDILTEQQLSDALARQDAALAVGKVIPAHVFFIGDVIERGREAEVVVRAVSTETGEIVETIDTHIADKESLVSLDSASRDLAQQMVAAFPRLSGHVMAVQGNDIFLDWTAEDGIHERMHVLVVDDVPPVVDDDGFVEIEGRAEPVGQAQIREVLKTNSRANTIRVEEGNSVEEWQGKAAVSM